MAALAATEAPDCPHSLLISKRTGLKNNRLEFPTVPVRVEFGQFVLHGKTGLGGSTPRNGTAGQNLEILIINDKAIYHQNFKLAAPEGIFRPLLWWLSKSGGKKVVGGGYFFGERSLAKIRNKGPTLILCRTLNQVRCPRSACMGSQIPFSLHVLIDTDIPDWSLDQGQSRNCS